MGSPVAFGGFIAMTSEDGETFMVKAGPKHEIVRTNTVDEPVYSSPAIANGRIYIRGEKHLFAIGLSSGDRKKLTVEQRVVHNEGTTVNRTDERKPYSSFYLRFLRSFVVNSVLFGFLRLSYR